MQISQRDEPGSSVNIKRHEGTLAPGGLRKGNARQECTFSLERLHSAHSHQRMTTEVEVEVPVVVVVVVEGGWRGQEGCRQGGRAAPGVTWLQGV